MMKSRDKDNISLWKILKRTTGMGFRACPVFFVLSNMFSIIGGVIMGLFMLMTQRLFDSAALLARNEIGIKEALIAGLWLGVIMVLKVTVHGIDNFMYSTRENLVEKYMGKLLNSKAGRLEPSVFEHTEYLDDIKRAREGIEASISLIDVFINIFTLYTPFFLIIGFYLYTIKPVLAISIVLIFVPVFISQLLRVKVFKDLAYESGKIKREYEYYERCMVDREYYKETRLIGAFHFFKGLYVDSLKLLSKHTWKSEKKAGILELGMKCVTLGGYMGVLLLLVDALIKGEITLGAFGAVFASVGFMFSVMEEIVCIRLGMVANRLGTVKNFIKFLDMPERNGKDVTIEGIPEISLEDVSFKYPGADSEAISEVSLKIEKGETIAIVGENGAGKTTIVKLMMGLYTPTKGKVLIGKEDTSEISTESLCENTSAVFQKYQRYQMTLGENIAISSLCENGKGDKILEAAAKADLEIAGDRFPEGYETMLSREFGGIDLSGGQWQRIAIARGLYKKHNMIVLDEPTAAIDPNMETEIYKKFAEISKDKTSIIVTHRLGSAKIADRIVVMDAGRISGIGTHEKLMESNRKYREMYEAQSKWYIKV